MIEENDMLIGLQMLLLFVLMCGIIDLGESWIDRPKKQKRRKK